MTIKKSKDQLFKELYEAQTKILTLKKRNSQLKKELKIKEEELDRIKISYNELEMKYNSTCDELSYDYN